MKVADVRDLFSYTEWANDRILESMRGLSEDQLSREIESSFRSILATDVVENLRIVENERRELLDSITDEDLLRELPYRSMKGDPFETRLDLQMVHVANHSTYHRGQLTTMIRQAGAVPPATDLIVYVRTRNDP
jgi:uncharacterized damage-inducible protein DinB